jgi:hypothetical protein
MIHKRWNFRRTISLTLIPIAAARRRPGGHPSPKLRIFVFPSSEAYFDLKDDL